MHQPDIQPELIARLQAQCPDMVSVQEAWFMEPLDNLGTETPAAFVYLSEDGATGEPQTTCPRQPVTLSYGVWLVCRRADFRPQRDAIRAALFGWVPSDQHSVVGYKGGKADIRGEYIWWREFWNVDTWYRAT